MRLTAEQREALKAGVENIERVLSQIDRLKQDWRSQIFTSLALNAATSYKHLNSGFESKDISLVAWAARRLVELNVWVSYITLSENHALKFYNDILSQANHSFSGLLKLFIQHPGFANDAHGQFKEQLDNLDKDMARANINKKDPYLTAKCAAKELGSDRLKFVTTWLGILSALVHATSLSVAPMVGAGANDALEEIFSMAAMEMLRICVTIKEKVPPGSLSAPA